ncbi:kelch domain-containing protein 4-like [Tigriopus californicus]|uniref:kelch domain-containing protein 4-like n=1 Tax=Tigriopus californicus TaxID=6832 RepID=UPI0027DA2C7F|nr:kelch domain-containing protein 4-like [Tigriopus californicus]
MGKKDKAKKKGKGAEKTAEKTAKKLVAKLKKETGEDDIESIVKAIEAEEKKRQEVKELHKVDPPSHRANFSLTPHADNPELILFGGEFYNGQKTILFNDLFLFNTKRREWSQIVSPGGPPPRCSHQAVMTSQNGGQLWIFGGEYASPNETQFYHYKDLWCFHFSSKRWEKISATGGPSSRSGHRMVLTKKHLIIFGGFHDNLRECKYFNDVYAFDLDNLKWKKLDVSGASPAPRSACNMFVLPDGRIVVFAGYAKEKGKKDSESGITYSDMFVLTPDKHDTTMTKWKWNTVKQVGYRPSTRTGMSVAVAPNSVKIFLFGGVQDVKDEDEDLEGNFFNDLYSVQVENERATWHKVELSGKKDVGAGKRRRRKSAEGQDDVEDGDDEAQQEDAKAIDDKLSDLNLKEDEPKTVTVEEGAFTITSTIGIQEAEGSSAGHGTSSGSENTSKAFIPPPRFGSGLAVKQGDLFMFGGVMEDGDKQYTLKDFYSLDIHKFDEWQTIIESDLKSMEWFESDSDSDEDEDSDESGEMDTD